MPYVRWADLSSTWKQGLFICVILTPKGNYSLFNMINMNSKILYSTDSFGHSILFEKVPCVILVSWSKLQNNEYKLPMTFLTVGPRLPLCWWARKCLWSFFFFFPKLFLVNLRERKTFEAINICWLGIIVYDPKSLKYFFITVCTLGMTTLHNSMESYNILINQSKQIKCFSSTINNRAMCSLSSVHLICGSC